MNCPTGCMKQIHNTMIRAFTGSPPLPSSKWKAIMQWSPLNHGYYINLFHYHHLVLTYNINHQEILHLWYEKPTDKRGLDSALIWLKAFHEYANAKLSEDNKGVLLNEQN